MQSFKEIDKRIKDFFDEEKLNLSLRTEINRAPPDFKANACTPIIVKQYKVMEHASIGFQISVPSIRAQMYINPFNLKSAPLTC